MTKNSKLSVSIVVALCATCYLASMRPTQGQQAIASDKSRFFLFQGHVQIVGPATTYEEPIVFRIDSQTGHSWRYSRGGQSDGRTIPNFWIEIAE